MRLGSMRYRRKYAYERVRCTKGWTPGAEAMGSSSFLSASTGVYERERGHRKERICAAMVGRIGGLHYGLYIPLSLPGLVSRE